MIRLEGTIYSLTRVKMLRTGKVISHLSSIHLVMGSNLISTVVYHKLNNSWIKNRFQLIK